MTRLIVFPDVQLFSSAPVVDLGVIQKVSEGLFPDLLGVEFVEATREQVVAELVVRDDLCTIPGRLHGGALMAFADTLGAVGTALNLEAGAGSG